LGFARPRIRNVSPVRKKISFKTDLYLDLSGLSLCNKSGLAKRFLVFLLQI